MAETDVHRNLMVYSIEGLKIRYADRPDVYVSGNNFVFWEEGNPKARISPDCYVVFGVGGQERDSYMVWKENGRAPSVVFEFTSRKTRQEDVETKLPLYETVLRVPEYFLFDPTGDYLRPRLKGYRLPPDGRYVPIEPVNGRLHSEQLKLDLVQEGETLRFFDPARGEFLPTSVEMARRANEEARRADAEAEARRAAEAEIARLRAEIEALRRSSPEEG